VTETVAIPIWRDPWMVVGGSTFASDLARRLGWANAFADETDRYPRVDLEDIYAAGAQLVLLPDEPYTFTSDDGPEAFPSTPTKLVSGRLLTWYGPSLVEAAHLLD
jgi:ABC-type Fe3+-hydroxamate transport system substrate-binding protein